MAGFSLLQTALSLLVLLLVALSAADQPIITTSCTAITLEPSGLPSTLTTLPRTLWQTTQGAPSQAPTPYEPEPEPEPSFTVASDPEETKQPPGPHHVTMSVPLPDLPPRVSTPPTQQQQQPSPPTPSPIPPPTTLPPSTTWRYDPNYYPPPPRPTPKPCNELNDMAFANYQHTQSLCQQAATLLPKEVQRLIASQKGHDFRPYCKVSPPTRCCDSVWEMLNAERCFSWWPSKDKAEYYEPPFWKDGGSLWQ